VTDLEVRYAAELDPVLKGLNFSVKPQEKIGVVGRTGSGKSTLALSFFRFVEATRGSIVIDGIDIKDLGTEDLRSNLTIIPQDPTLFSGSLRSNMDPFDQFTDDDIFTALRRVQLLPSEDLNSIASDSTLDKVNANVFKDLEISVTEGGKNFSQGQRQLLCLARALLKRSRIVLMDEATASVDFETDAKIQTTIRQEFTNSTLLCIAHRLRTVIDYDRVLVLDQGHVVEYDTPYNLIQGGGKGVFKSMCEQSGEMEILLKMATESNNNKDSESNLPDNHNPIY
jgi:ABC-type multidrug transport system fused ATPase/permease subunit